MLNVLFSDNHVLAVDKAPGIPTQGEKGEISLHDEAKEWVKRAYQKPGNVFLEPIHRLDKPVGGIVLFARTSKALSRLQQAMREKKIRKTYRAWVEGIIEKEEGKLEHFLMHGEHKAEVVASHDTRGKYCVLHFHTLFYKENKTLIEIDLITGRYHQIRAQLSAVGHPIWGDKKYGSSEYYPSDGIALHHTQLELEHPVQGTLLVLQSPRKLFSDLDSIQSSSLQQLIADNP